MQGVPGFFALCWSAVWAPDAPISQRNLPHQQPLHANTLHNPFTHPPHPICVCLQRFRFTTSVLYTVCVSCEFLTPRFPSHFLLLTAVSNVGRAVGLTTFVSTQPAFQQALCASGNMADLASKTQVGPDTPLAGAGDRGGVFELQWGWRAK